MNRYFEMTETARQATWTQTTGGPHIPTKWLIKGDKEDGYTIAAINDDMCGFDFITLRTLYAAKSFIQQVNTTGTTDFKKHCSVGSFAWANVPMPVLS